MSTRPKLRRPTLGETRDMLLSGQLGAKVYFRFDPTMCFDQCYIEWDGEAAHQLQLDGGYFPEDKARLCYELEMLGLAVSCARLRDALKLLPHTDEFLAVRRSWDKDA